MLLNKQISRQWCLNFYWSGIIGEWVEKKPEKTIGSSRHDPPRPDYLLSALSGKLSLLPFTFPRWASSKQKVSTVHGYLSLGCSYSVLSVWNALSYLGLKATLLAVSVANIILNLQMVISKRLSNLPKVIQLGVEPRVKPIPLFPVRLTPLKDSQPHQFVRSEHTFPSSPLINEFLKGRIYCSLILHL